MFRRKFALEDKHKLNAANFVVEGPTVMPHTALLEFLARCFLVLVLAMVSQLPSAMDVMIDSDLFLSAFFYVDEKGVRQRVGSWKNGPGWRASRPRSDDAMDEDPQSDGHDDAEIACRYLTGQHNHLVAQWKKWTDHENRCGAHIPSALCCVASITPLEGWTVGQPLPKIKPLRFNIENSGSSSESMSS